jgi:hypothetical protein
MTKEKPMLHTRTQRLRRVGLAALAVGSVAGSLLAVGLATPASASVVGLKINEVESNGDATDWIELYNPTGSAINMSGAILADNDNSHAFPLSGTIAAGGYAVFDVSVGTGNFGLGAPDSARLFDGASTSATQIDATSWTTHAGTTWGRLPNGSGSFGVTGASTRGAANVPPGGVGNIDGVVINEVESDADAVNGDWVELYNSTGSAIDISGALITDDDTGHVFRVPASTSLPADDYAAFRVDDPLVTGNFGLGAADEVHLYPAGDVTFANEVDSFTWSVHAVETYGRDWTVDNDFDGLGDWAPTSAGTFDAENDQFTPGAGAVLTGVIVNEVKTTGDDVHGDWIELRNTSGTSRTIAGAILADDNDAHALRLPSGTPALAAGAIAAFRVDDTTVPGNFGLGDADSARLFTSDTIDLAASSPVSTRTWTQHGRTSLGWDGSSFIETRLPTFGTANDFSSAFAPDASWVVLSEVDSSVASSGQDFVELKNTSGVTIDISGMILSDSDNAHAYSIPASTTLAAGAECSIEVDNAAVTGLNRFGLGSDDAIRLYRAGATVGTSIPLDHHEWTAHATDPLAPGVDKTYTRTSSGLGEWAVANPSKAGAC